jgi:hypothetical protein
MIEFYCKECYNRLTVKPKEINIHPIPRVYVNHNEVKFDFSELMFHDMEVDVDLVGEVFYCKYCDKSYSLQNVYVETGGDFRSIKNIIVITFKADNDMVMRIPGKIVHKNRLEESLEFYKVRYPEYEIETTNLLEMLEANHG